MMINTQFNLYSSDGCHLCELALELCEPLQRDGRLSIIDIVDSPEHVEQYGHAIPVLERLSDNVKLYWPFTAQQVNELI